VAELNEDIADALTEQGVKSLRVVEAIYAIVSQHLDKLEKELAALVKTIDPTGVEADRYRKGRTEKLEKESQSLILARYKKMFKAVRKELMHLSAAESRKVEDVLRRAINGA